MSYCSRTVAFFFLENPRILRSVTAAFLLAKIRVAHHKSHLPRIPDPTKLARVFPTRAASVNVLCDRARVKHDRA